MIVYDTGPLIAADRGDSEFLWQHAQHLAKGLSPRIPAGVLAQVWRGGSQAMLSRVLGTCVIEELDEQRARAAGTLCAIAGTTDVVDASVVILAHQLGAAVITADVDDLGRLAAAGGFDIPLIAP